MANNLRIYTFEDTQTGETIKIEGPEGASDEELYAFLESSASQTPTRNPSVQVIPQTQAQPQRRAAAGPVTNNIQETVQPGYESSPPAQQIQLSPADEQTWVNMQNDLNVPDEEALAWLQSKGMNRDPRDAQAFAQEFRSYRQQLRENPNATPSSAVGYTQGRDYVSELVGRPEAVTDAPLTGIEAALESGSGMNPLGVFGRLYNDWADAEVFGITKESLKERYPFMSDEEVERLHDDLIGEARRRELAQNEANVARANPNAVTRFLGEMAGSSSPIDLIPMGRGATFGTRLAEGAASNALMDAGMQASDVAYGAQESFNPQQTFMAGVEGAAFQGILEGGARAATAGARALAPAARRMAEALPQRRAQPTPVEAPSVNIPENRRGSRQYAQQIDTTIDSVVDLINHEVRDWENAPSFSVARNFNDVRGMSRENRDSVGFYDSGTGQVHINTEAVLKAAKEKNVSPEDVVRAVTFHEALGHYGLAQTYQDGLDGVLNRFYEGGTTSFKNMVDDWIKRNPNTYTNDPNLKARATEEVMANMSNKGKLQAKLVDVVSNWLKKFARERLGRDLKYSPREVKTIMAMSHSAVINGKKADVRGNGFRFGKVFHGSAAKFDQPNHDYMSSGEGAQVYGWGTYAAENKEIAEHYKDTLSRRNLQQIKRDRLSGMTIFPDGQAVADWIMENPLAQGIREQELNEIFEAADNSDNMAGHLQDLLDMYQDELAFGLDSDRLKKTRKIYGADSPEVHEFLRVMYSFQQAQRLVTTLRDKVLQEYPVALQTKGHLYEFDRPEDAAWLDWDNVPTGKAAEILEREFGIKPGDPADIAKTEKRINHIRDEIDGLRDQRDALNEIEGFVTDHFLAFQESHDYSREAETLYEKTYPEMAKERVEYQELRKELTRKAQKLQDELKALFDQYPKTSGQDIYAELVKRLGSPKAASQALFKAGIHGTKYLDGMSRKSGKGSYNYVFYDDKSINVLARYGSADELFAPEFSAEDLTEIQNAAEVVDLMVGDWTPTLVSHEDVRGMARASGLNNGHIKRMKGLEPGQIAQRLVAYDNLMMKMSENLATLYERIKAGDLSVKDKYIDTLLKAQHLSAVILNSQGEIGRALNTIKNLSISRQKITDLNEALASVQGNNIAGFASDDVFRRFADQMNVMMQDGNPAGVASLAKSVVQPYWWQKVLTARHAMMLSGLATHAKNATDSAMMVAQLFEEKVGAALIGKLRKAEDGVSGAELGAHFYGVVRALADSSTWKDSWQAFREGHGSRSYSSRIEMADARVPVLSKVNDSLYAMDTFFRAIHNNANLYSLGVREARAQGFKGVEALQEGSAIALEPTEAMLKKANDLTDEALLVDAPSALSSGIEAAKAIKPGMTGGEQTKAFTLNFVFSFLRTTDRLLFQAIRRSPFAWLDKNTGAAIRAGGAERDIAIFRALYGSALIAKYWLADSSSEEANNQEEGTVQGKGPSDRDKTRALEAGGFRPNSVIKGGKYVDASALNLSWLPGDEQNNIAASVATLRQRWEEGSSDKNSTAAGFFALSQATLQLLGSQSYAENLGPVVDLFREQEQTTPEVQAANFVGNVASQFVPAALRQFNQQVTDPIKRNTSGDGSFSDRVYGRIASAVPGLSDDLPAARTNLGDEVSYGRTTFGMNNYTDIRQDEVTRAFDSVERSTSSVVLRRAPASFEFEGETIKLTAEGREEWQRRQGYYLRTLMEEELASNPGFRSLPQEEQVAIVKDIAEDAYKYAKEDMLPLLGLSGQ